MSPAGRWEKRGLLLDQPGPADWVQSHVALPSLHRDRSGSLWMYYSGRDAKGRAHISRCPIRAEAGALSAGESEAVLAPGELGAFDDAGVTHSTVVTVGERTYLYYSGWTLGQSVPFYFYAGLAISDDDGATFVRASRAPVLERVDCDPFLTASPSVLHEDGRWRTWYVSGGGWPVGEDGINHLYNICYAESDDGVAWRRDGSVAIDFLDGEYALGRPCVERVGDVLHMWFCARGDRYRIAHAWSDDDARTWHRTGEPEGLAPAESGWDSEMACYPFVFEDDDVRYLLYNGNGYGASGVGYAVQVAS